MNDKQKAIAKKVGVGVINALTVIIVIFALIMAISAIISNGKPYTNLFGYTFLKVESDSMNPTFKAGDVIKVKIIDSEEASSLAIDTIITFTDINIQKGKTSLNTHRIVDVTRDMSGNIASYITQGDNKITNGTVDMTPRLPSEVVGVYQGKGSAFLAWLTSTTGFMVMVVVPTILVLIYCIVLVIIAALQYKKKKENEAAVLSLDEIKEQAKREALEELRREQAAEAARQQALEQATEKQNAEVEVEVDSQDEDAPVDDPSDGQN